AGLVRLLMAAMRGESWLARLVLAWFVLPLVAISFGTSKLLHYAYPFWPPIALGAGLAAATLLNAARGFRLVAVIVVLVLLLPTAAYVKALEQTQRVEHPLRAIRDCMNTIRVAETAGIGSGVFIASGSVLHHAYYYYFRRQGLWTIAPMFQKKDAADHLRV